MVLHFRAGIKHWLRVELCELCPCTEAATAGRKVRKDICINGYKGKPAPIPLLHKSDDVLIINDCMLQQVDFFALQFGVML